MIEKNTQPRHTNLKATASLITFGKSRSTRISLLTVFVTVRDSYGFVWVTLEVSFNLSKYHWLCISELIKWITSQQTFHVWSKLSVIVKQQRFLLKECEEHHGIFHTGSLTMPNLLYLELYLPQNDSILLPFNPDEVQTNLDWLGK